MNLSKGQKQIARAALLALLCLTAVRSATLVVNSPVDTEKPVGSCGGNCNLRTAWHLMEAGDTISIQVDPVMDKPITEKKAPNSFYTIKGDTSDHPEGCQASFTPSPGGGPGSAFQLDPFQGGIIFENLDFSNFTATNQVYGVFYMTAESTMGPSDGDITFKNCNFYNNFGAENGIIQVTSSNNVRIQGCSFAGNKGTLTEGTVVAIQNTDLVSISDCVFDTNSSPGSMINVAADKFSIDSTSFTGNTAVQLVSAANSLLVSYGSFSGNSISSSLVNSQNVTFVGVTGEVTKASDTVYHNLGSSTTSLALNSCKFTSQTGDDVKLTSSANGYTVIFNLAPKSKALSNGGPEATFANCNEVQAGPLACGYGDYCVLVRKAGKAVGYLCLTSEEAEAHRD